MELINTTSCVWMRGREVGCSRAPEKLHLPRCKLEEDGNTYTLAIKTLYLMEIKWEWPIYSLAEEKLHVPRSKWKHCLSAYLLSGIWLADGRITTILSLTFQLSLSLLCSLPILLSLFFTVLYASSPRLSAPFFPLSFSQHTQNW